MRFFTMRIYCERVHCNYCSYGNTGDKLPSITYKVLYPKIEDSLSLFLNVSPSTSSVNFDLSKITVSVVPCNTWAVCARDINTRSIEDLSSITYEGVIKETTRGDIGELSTNLSYQCAIEQNVKQIEYPKSLKISTIDAENKMENIVIFEYENPPIPYDYSTEQ